LDVEETVRDSPAYITLCTARILDAWSYPSKALKKSFFQELVWVRFDVIWGPQEVDPRRVQRALMGFKGRDRELLPGFLDELNRVFDQRLSLATMCVLESFLVIFLRARLNKESPSPQGMARNSVTELLAEARSGKVFPDSLTAAVFQMAGILTSVFPDLANAEIPETITPRVLSQIAVMIKILVDLAVIRWSEVL
jgi:hypothetical protein